MIILIMVLASILGVAFAIMAAVGPYVAIRMAQEVCLATVNTPKDGMA